MTIETPIGPLTLTVVDGRLVSLEFGSRPGSSGGEMHQH